MSEPIDLGHGVTLTPVNHRCLADAPEGALVPTVDTPESHFGYIERHASLKTGEPCAGSLQTCQRCNFQRSRWTETEGPTLSPSVMCTVCGNHGWVRDGRWAPA